MDFVTVNLAFRFLDLIHYSGTFHLISGRPTAFSRYS